MDNSSGDISKEFTNLFFKVWRNIVLKNKILRYCKQKHYGKKHFFDIKAFNNSNVKAKYENISIGDVEDKLEFINFLRECPHYIDLIEFSNLNTQVLVDIKEIIIPSTLKVLKFNSGINIYNSDQPPLVSYYFNRLFGISGGNENDGSSKEIIKNNFKNLKSIQLGEGSLEILYGYFLPDNLISLTLNCQLKSPITKDMVPNKVRNFSITQSYTHSSLYLPSGVEKVSLGYSREYYVNTNVLLNIPSSCTSLKLLFETTAPLKPLPDKLAASLKRLIVLDDKKMINNQPPFYLNRNMKSLTSLDISNIFKCYQYTIDIDLLPPTLVKLKLPTTSTNQTPIVQDSKSIGFPSSLTHLSGKQAHFKFLFQNYSNLKSMSITFAIDESPIINYRTKFPNLVSMCFNLYTIAQIFNNNSPLPNNLKNLEINELSKMTENLDLMVTSRFAVLSYLKPLKNLNSLKLNSYLSTHLFNKLFYIEPNLSSSFIFSNLKVLYLSAHGEPYNIYDATQFSDLHISSDSLPSLKVLIINTKISINLNSQLPDTLKYVFLSTCNQMNHQKLKSVVSSKKIRSFNALRDCPIHVSGYLKSYVFKKFRKIFTSSFETSNQIKINKPNQII